jgi:hypothetical protein
MAAIAVTEHEERRPRTLGLDLGLELAPGYRPWIGELLA